MLHAVIMAGGSGTRFWPKSTKAHPKQFLTFFGDQTMLQATAGRIKNRISADRIWVITNERYIGLVEDQLPEVPTSNIVGEPVAKNTAPCIAAAATLIQHEDPNASMAVLPADHLISQSQKFLTILDAAAAKAEQESSLITIGITPNRPETGYGYIEFDEDSSEQIKKCEFKKVQQFREKPDKQTAQNFIAAGNFLWNSGMFVWQTDTILREFEQHLPEIYQQVEALKAKLGDGNASRNKAVAEFYKACPSVSVDYGIMERSKSVFVVPGSFGWNDVGDWRAARDLLPKDEQDNVIKSENVELEKSSGNLIQTESDKMVALVGVDNLAVVETEDAILVCNLDEAQGVKKIVNRLKDSDDLKRFL